jgi:hypothetical protein
MTEEMRECQVKEEKRGILCLIAPLLLIHRSMDNVSQFPKDGDFCATDVDDAEKIGLESKPSEN